MIKFEDILKIRTKEIEENYIIVTYDVVSSISLKKAAWDIAIGQSIGNPDVRNKWETKELFDNHSCLILKQFRKDALIYNFNDFTTTDGTIEIAFPVINGRWKSDGIAHLLCQIMGGQADIDHITACRVVDIHIPEVMNNVFLGPKFGLSGIKKYTNTGDQPLLGGIMKPKTGLSPDQMLDMTKDMVYGGVSFIKEDEILSDPYFCPLEKRVELIANFREKCGIPFVFCHSINCDPGEVEKRVNKIYVNGGNGVHINIWSGLGVYNTIRQLDLPIYIHYQKSGDKVITHPSNHFGISWKVLVKLAALCGVDTIHAGMYGGYLNDNPQQLKEVVDILVKANVVPALSCGMHPGLVEKIRKEFGSNWMANVGGAIHGHPSGTKAGAGAMRQAIDRKYKQEYGEAINTWGFEK